MPLPSPLPDDPKKWNGWRNYNSENPYERLCLDYEQKPTSEEIEENCRKLLIWWQRKLPLKNQPSNPVAAMLRSGIDEAPRYLSQARAELLDPEGRARVDAELLSQLKEKVHAEFSKFLTFSLLGGILSKDAEAQLNRLGLEQGLSENEIREIVDAELERTGAQRQSEQPAETSSATAGTQGTAAEAAATTRDPEQEFLRLLDLAGLEDGEMTDDQRDAFVNMAENLGIDPGRAEDMIDDWIDEQEQAMFSAVAKAATAKKPMPKISTAAAKFQNVQSPNQPHTQRQASKPIKIEVKRDMSEAEELQKYTPFTTASGIPMLFIPSCEFEMGSVTPPASPAEAPVHKVHLTRFYISQAPITNLQYEMFDPSHRSKRPAWSDDNHPVVYVSSRHAMNFCEWLSKKEKKRFRLPTEAEWEYVARGSEPRMFPWGNAVIRGNLANFADRNTNFSWSDKRVDDGYAQTSPVENYPNGASPFGALDMAGNVWEWCLDYFGNYSNAEQKDPRGAASGSKRVYRGGSWRSRLASLRTTSRGFNDPEYSYNDIGFRVACEC